MTHHTDDQNVVPFGRIAAGISDQRAMRDEGGAGAAPSPLRPVTLFLLGFIAAMLLMAVMAAFDDMPQCAPEAVLPAGAVAPR